MRPKNSDGNVNDEEKNPEEAIWQCDEILEICYQFEKEILCDEVVVREWVRLDIVVAVNWRRKTRRPEISFSHVEVEEEIPSSIIETVEEILANSLFNLWLDEKGAITVK